MKNSKETINKYYKEFQRLFAAALEKTKNYKKEIDWKNLSLNQRERD